MWNILMAIWPLLLPFFVRAKLFLVKNVRKILLIVLIPLFILVGCFAYVISFYDHSRFWGIPFSHELEQQKVNPNLQAEIQKHREEVKRLLEQHKYLHKKLFNATVLLDEKSKMSFMLINRFGPMGNLHLKDFTKTAEAEVKVSTYSVNLPADSPLRDVMDDLRESLSQEKIERQLYLQKIGEYHIMKLEEESIRAQMKAEEEQRRWEESLNKPYEPIPYQSSELIPYDPNQPIEPEVPVEPISYRSHNRISEADGMLLYDTHKLMSDIQAVQTRMAKVVTMIVDKYELLDSYSAPPVPSKYMFMQEKSRGHVDEGMKLFACTLRLFWCTRVGTVKGILGQHATGRHPVSGKMVDGFVVEIELDKDHHEILHVRDGHAI